MDIGYRKNRHVVEKVTTTRRQNKLGVVVVFTMLSTMVQTMYRYTTTSGSRKCGLNSFATAYVGVAPHQRWNARFASQPSTLQHHVSTRIFSTTQENTEESVTAPDAAVTATPAAVTPVDFQFDMDDVISLCKRRGLIFPSSEIYNGYAGFYDYGPIGVELKRSVKDYWWKTFVTSREDVVGLDSSIIHNPTTWKSSGTWLILWYVSTCTNENFLSQHFDCYYFSMQVMLMDFLTQWWIVKKRSCAIVPISCTLLKSL